MDFTVLNTAFGHHEELFLFSHLEAPQLRALCPGGPWRAGRTWTCVSDVRETTPSQVLAQLHIASRTKKRGPNARHWSIPILFGLIDPELAPVGRLSWRSPADPRLAELFLWLPLLSGVARARTGPRTQAKAACPTATDPFARPFTHTQRLLWLLVGRITNASRWFAIAFSAIPLGGPWLVALDHLTRAPSLFGRHAGPRCALVTMGPRWRRKGCDGLRTGGFGVPPQAILRILARVTIIEQYEGLRLLVNRRACLHHGSQRRPRRSVLRPYMGPHLGVRRRRTLSTRICLGIRSPSPQAVPPRLSSSRRRGRGR